MKLLNRPGGSLNGSSVRTALPFTLALITILGAGKVLGQGDARGTAIRDSLGQEQYEQSHGCGVTHFPEYTAGRRWGGRGGGGVSYDIGNEKSMCIFPDTLRIAFWQNGLLPQEGVAKLDSTIKVALTGVERNGQSLYLDITQPPLPQNIAQIFTNMGETFLIQAARYNLRNGLPKPAAVSSTDWTTLTAWYSALPEQDKVYTGHLLVKAENGFLGLSSVNSGGYGPSKGAAVVRVPSNIINPQTGEIFTDHVEGIVMNIAHELLHCFGGLDHTAYVVDDNVYRRAPDGTLYHFPLMGLMNPTPNNTNLANLSAEGETGMPFAPRAQNVFHDDGEPYGSHEISLNPMGGVGGVQSERQKVDAVIDMALIPGCDLATPTDDIPDLPEINLYPNPTDGPVTIQFPKAFTGTVQVASVTGKIEQNHQVTGHSTLNLKLQDLPAGVYVVTLVYPNGMRVVKKVVKK